MKKIISAVLTASMLFSISTSIPLTASATTTNTVESNTASSYTDEYGAWNCKLTDDGTGYIITGYDQSKTEIEIPSSIAGRPVLQIAKSTFYGYDNLTSITVPASVISIENQAFNSRLLTEINVSPDNNHYSSIDGVLFNKEQTTLIRYPRSAPATYTIPDGVTTIDMFAFFECEFLTDVIIPNSVTSIKTAAFSTCFKLNNVTIPDSVTHIGDLAFDACLSLTNITLSKNLTAINYRTFAQSSFSTITIPESVTSIKEGAFYYSQNLTDVTIPGSVTTIDKSAFECCHNLTNVTISNGVTSIGEFAFLDCANLTTVTIPKSVTSIGTSAFASYSNITDVYYIGSESDWNKIVIQSGNETLTNATIHYSEPQPVVSSYTDEYGTWNCKLTDDGTGYIITGYDQSKTEIEIPSFIAGRPVLEIGDYAFSNYSTITDVTIPEGITHIGRNAFERCARLSKVTLSDTVTHIGVRAFFSCYSLTGITIPASVISIGQDAFFCNAMTSIDVSPDNTEYSSIDGVLFDKEQTTLIRYPEKKASDNYIIPDGVTTIAEFSFGCCDSVKTVTFPESLTTIEYYAFTFCSSLTHLTLPDNVTNIGIGAFDCCFSLTDITLPKTLTYITSKAFYSSGLTNITIPEGVTTIEESAFDWCRNLSSVTIPKSVTLIDYAAFILCSGLTDVYYEGSESDWNKIVIQSGNQDLTNATIHYNCLPPAVSSYTDEYGTWNCKLTSDGTGYIITGYDKSKAEIVIPSFIAGRPVLEIGDYAFSNYSTITDVTIPEGITHIGRNAFERCARLSKVTLPNTVTHIGVEAFFSCYSLTGITIPASVISIGQDAFFCNAMTRIDVSPDNTEYSSVDGVLFDKEQTTLIRYPEKRPSDNYIIPDGVTTIATFSFASCDSVSTVTFPESLTTIENCAFTYCTGLTHLTLPDNVINIGFAAFDTCINMTSITLPKTMTSIPTQAFVAAGLTSITIPEGVTTIETNAFNWCQNLSSVTIPKSVTLIDASAFALCCGLTDVYYEGSESDWNKIVIQSGNQDLTNATIHYNYVPPVEPLAGDVSGDGEIAVDDVIYTLKYIVGDIELTESQLTNADVSGDGNVTVLDAVLLQKIILG